MTPRRSPRLVLSAAAAAIVGVAALAANEVNARGGEAEARFIQRVVAQTTRSGLSLQSTRELRAGTLSGKHQAWMRVTTTLTPAGAFSWQVLEEGGSSRTREKVCRAVLQTEAESHRDGDVTAALTPANYVFTPLGSEVAGSEVRIRLQPKRRDTRLIDGVLTVNADGYPLRLEGTLAKSPSFWVKSVRVVKHYTQLAGVALPAVVESTADVKFVGPSRFTMRYSYTAVNGHAFPRAGLVAALTPGF